MGWQWLQDRERPVTGGGGGQAACTPPKTPLQCLGPDVSPLFVTFPSLVVPATCPVAMVTISGWTARLRRERTDGQGSVGARGPRTPPHSMARS